MFRRYGCDRCNICYMADLNLRAIPDELMAYIKVQAATTNLTIKEWCVQRLGPGAISAIPTAPPIRERESAKGKSERLAAVCHRCDKPLTEWGPGQLRCTSCAVNYPAA